MFRICFFTLLLSAQSVQAEQKPTRADAIACFDRFIERIAKTKEDPRDLAASLVDLEAVAYIGSATYRVDITKALEKVYETAAKERSNAFRNMDPQSVRFTRQGKAVSKSTGPGRQEYVYPLAGSYTQVGACTGEKTNQCERFEFTIWLRIKEPLCEAVDIEWQNAQFSMVVNK